ncbi:DNA-binding domain-containing protein [Tissierella sp. MB52-C2]|uniref:DNA-binding domain-containing protein n=1 Tax=Tissierella sp. MB52-C2 TaxID=3070999 RepID=UPI00280BA96C|nr:DNA-binding domain-containing protein [Tissierella sp. MB52-C2]WMM25142.1 DNA-binding domain-containing protein [Tissierella sp. MB52-C2]
MKIFVLDKNSKDINILKKIIRSNNLGLLVGESNDFNEGLEEIIFSSPDLVVLDHVGNKTDGFYIIDEIKRKGINTRFIMISDFTSKKNIERAYEEGVEYAIYKPINDLEVKTIIEKVKYKIELEEKIKKVQEIFKDTDSNLEETVETNDCERDVNLILLKLGIMGEIGSTELLKVVKFLIQNNIKLNDISIREICSKFTSNPKVMEQKMRRAINTAMSNVAALGIEDYMNETFMEYSNTLFNFEQTKREMDYLRGRSQERGTINMKKFLSGICLLCENQNN